MIVCLVLSGLACGGSPPRQPSAPVELFSRSWLLPVLLSDVPAADEVGRAVDLFATPGEFEPASVGVHTTVALRQARWSVSPLSSESGATIAPDRFEWRITRYIDPTQYQQFGRWPKDESNPLQPGFLDPARPIDIEAGTTRQFWLTAHVPDDAAPGQYRGSLTFEADGVAPQSLPISLEVYPFRLQPVRPAFFASGDNWPLDGAVFEDVRRHGMNTLCINQGHVKVLGSYKDGLFEYPDMIRNVDNVITLARQHGLGVTHEVGVMLYGHLTRSTPAVLAAAGIKHPEIEVGFDDRDHYWVFYERGEGVELKERFRGTYWPAADVYTPPNTEYGKLLYRGWVSAMSELDAAGKARGWPKLWYWLTDEPHVNRGRMRSAMVMAQAAHEAGSTSMITCNEPTVSEPDPEKWWYPPIGDEPELKLEPWLVSRCYNNAYIGEVTLERTRSRNGVYGTYVNSYGNQPASVRYQTGLMAFRAELDLVMIWAYEPMSSGEKENPRTFLREWEAVREGVDDLKYLEALQRAARAGNAEAVTLLDRLWEEVPANVRAVGFVDSFTGTWVRGKQTFKPERFDQIRREIGVLLSRTGVPSGA